MKHILLVDDDRAVARLLERALGDYRLTVRHEGDEALAVARVDPVDLLITDYLMPSMTGDELIGLVRQERPGVKVLVITAHGDILDRENPEWWMSELHLTKPFRIERLRSTVADLIGPAVKLSPSVPCVW